MTVSPSKNGFYWLSFIFIHTCLWEWNLFVHWTRQQVRSVIRDGKLWEGTSCWRLEIFYCIYIYFFFFFFSPKTHKKIKASDELCVCAKLDISSSSAPYSSSVIQKLLRTHQWTTLLEWLTCSFITMNTHTVVYLDSIPHTPSCCPKYSLKHRMWINLPLKIVPNKCTVHAFGIRLS